MDEILRRTHIAPIAGVDESAHLGSGGQQAGENLAFHRHVPTARDAIDDVAREDIAAGVDLVGRRILGLLQECQDVSVGVGGNRSERTRVTDPDQMQRDIRIAFVMSLQHRAEVHPGQHVTVEHHHGVVAQHRRNIGDTATGSERLVLGDVIELQPQLRAVTELGLERAWLVGRSQNHMVDTGLGDPRQKVGQKRQACGRQHRLG